MRLLSHNLKIFIFTGLLFSCSRNVTVSNLSESHRTSIDSIAISNSFDSILNEYIQHSVQMGYPFPVINYVKVIEITSDKKKIYLSLMNDRKLSDSIYVDAYFIKDKQFFFVDYGINPILNNERTTPFLFLKKRAIKPEFLDRQIISSWLFEITNNDSVLRVNKRAHDIFGPICENCPEWGYER